MPFARDAQEKEHPGVDEHNTKNEFRDGDRGLEHGVLLWERWFL
jgi:hypothetical protein